MSHLSGYSVLALLLLRLLVAAIFGASGWSHLAHPAERSQSLGMTKAFTVFLGAAELAGALSLASGILIQFAALGLVLVMLGAIYKKMVVWKSGFWGKGSQGWHYDLLLLLINLVFLTTGAGKYAIGSLLAR
ncbi:MAG TPA: DoxX family protein [Verrucomicrobiae bacterium]|nr:DoxX family protein [Verrucomicrobiae bacterium]